MLVRIILLLSLLFQITCAQKNEKSYQDLYALRILLETATKPKPNPQAACIDAMRSAEACIATAPEFQSGTLTENSYSLISSSNRFTTYSDLCANNLYMYPLPANFVTNNSDAVRECYFKCDSSYWKTRKNLNTCNGTVAIMTTGIFNDSGTTTCKRNCSSSVNNTP
jgi:hypothetical protein